MGISAIRPESLQTAINEGSNLFFSKKVNPNFINFGTAQATTGTLEPGNYFSKYVSLNTFVDVGGTVSLGGTLINSNENSLSLFNLSTSENREILTTRTFGFSTTIGLKHVTYQNNLFLGTQGSSSPTRSIAAKSTDGLTWDTVILSSSVASISQIFFAKATNKYYALIDFTNWRESTNFVTWTSSLDLVSPDGVEHLAYVNNLYFRRPRNGGRIQSSTDFITWTTATTFAPEDYEDITYFNGNYVCANRLTIRRSTNGIVWTSAFSFTSTRFQTIATNGKIIVSSGYISNSGSGTTHTFWSTNLINWSTANVIGLGEAQVRHASSANLFLINFTSRAFLSNNGINWTTGPSFAGSFTGTKQGTIAAGANRMVIAFSSTSPYLDVAPQGLLQIYKQ